MRRCAFSSPHFWRNEPIARPNHRSQALSRPSVNSERVTGDRAAATVANGRILGKTVETQELKPFRIACDAWRKLPAKPETITSIGMWDWAHVGQHYDLWYNKIGGMDRQTLRDFVHRFKAAGPHRQLDGASQASLVGGATGPVCADPRGRAGS